MEQEVVTIVSARSDDGPQRDEDAQEQEAEEAEDSRAKRKSYMRNRTRKVLDVDTVFAKKKKEDSSLFFFGPSKMPMFGAFTSFADSTKFFQGQNFRNRMRCLVHHRCFDFVISFFILINAVYIGLETELADESSGFVLGWYIAEVTFTLVFLTELILRLIASRDLHHFLGDAWNVFDLILVLVSCSDTFLISLLARSSTKTSGLMNAFQTVRLVRIARMVRLLRFFHEMWMLVAGIVQALWTLLWTWILLVSIIFVFGIFATRMIGQPHASESEELDTFFGTLPRSMFSLFQVTTTDGWAKIARAAMRQDGWTALFFVLYLYVTTCAVLNVVVAVIVENTLDQAVTQREKFNAKLQRTQKDACVKIYQIFNGLDNNGDGMLTRAEYLQALQDQQIASYLHQLGIDMRMAEELFSILDFDESDSLDAQEFVGGMLKAIGPAKAREVLALHCDLWRSQKKVSSRIKGVQKDVISQMKAVQRGVHELRTDVVELTNAVAEARKTASSQQIVSSQPSSFEPASGHSIAPVAVSQREASSSSSSFFHADTSSAPKTDNKEWNACEISETPSQTRQSSKSHATCELVDVDCPPDSPKECW